MVIKIFIVFCIIIVCSLVYSLIASYIFENKRIQKQREIQIFRQRHNLIPKEISSKYEKMSLDDYLHFRKFEFSDVATLSFKLIETEKEKIISDFGLKLDYYFECKKDLSNYKNEILMLWQEYFKIFYWYEKTGTTQKADLAALASLTRKSGLHDTDNSDFLDGKLLEIIQKERRQLPNFLSKLNHLISWSNFRFDGYLDIMKLGVTINEVEEIKHFWNHNEEEFSNLKVSNTYLSTAFYEIVRESFDRFSTDSNIYRFISLYKQVSFWVLDVYKRLDEGEKYSEVYINYRRVKRRSLKKVKLYWDYLLDFTTGYGEKPTRLLIFFVAAVALFSIIYYPYSFSPFEFENLKEENVLSTSISVVYLNFTIMLSNLFGHITPENAITKLFVIVQQVIGFTLTGSFITLFLRKIFRD